MKIEFYLERARVLNAKVQELKSIENRYVVARVMSVLLALVLGWFLVWYVGVFFAVIFFALIKKNDAISRERKFMQELQTINTKEASILETHKSDYRPGVQFQEVNHAYSADLDIFIPHGLFAFLNRCSSYRGEQILAGWLNRKLETEQIRTNQKCIQELAPLVDWRQNFQAAGSDLWHKKDHVTHLLDWFAGSPIKPNKLSVVLCYALPAMFVSAAIWANIQHDGPGLRVAALFFVINLVFFGLWFKSIIATLGKADKLHETLIQLHSLSAMASNAPFQASHLQSLQHPEHAEVLAQLAKQFEKLSSVQNFLVAALFNGVALYHVRAYFQLINFQRKNKLHLQLALDSIAELEALSSLSNYAYNFPEHAFPELNNERKISFNNLKHPLLSPKKAVGNSISFEEHPFVILTGSNMSGKSTFLRALGINMVLANCGSCVAASAASVHPMDVLVSMRLDDSLEDSTSYFYAETLRLQSVMHHLTQRDAFVLLDEILRGTNSDDKREGTIAVIEQLVNRKAIGAIATHDLEVCAITSLYPDALSNKCFEVQISGNEMTFDYTLREGICQNKSASFIMHKLGILGRG